MKPVRSDFLNWAIDVPNPDTPSSSPQPPSQSRRAGHEQAQWDASPAPAIDDWAQGTPRPPPPAPEVIPVPSPRRPVWVSHEPEGPWAAEPAAAEPAAAGPAAPHPAAAPLASPEAATNAAAHAFAAISGRPTAVGATPDAPLAEFVRLFARGAGPPEETFPARDPAEFAQQPRPFMRLFAQKMKQLPQARPPA